MRRCSLSIDLGSARGSIILDSSGVAKGVQSAVSALKGFESQTAGAGRNLDKLSQAGQQSGAAVSKGVQQASQSLKQLGDAGQQAGSAVAKGTQQATEGVERLARSTQDIGSSLDTLGNAAGLLGGSFAAGIGLAVKSASDLQTEIAAISTIKPDINVKQVGDEISAMTTRVAQSQTQLAQSLYGIFGSVEVSQDQALQLVEQFAQGAIAARTDAETFGTAILGVTSAYKMDLTEATHVSDVFFNTVADGVVSGEQLANGLGNLAQSANAANISFDTLGALIAGITKSGGSAETNLNNLQNVLAKITTSDVQKGLQDLGIATKNADGSFRDILSVLRDLDGVLAKMSQSQRTDVLQKLFPDQQARLGLQTLLGQLDFISTAAEKNAKAVGVTSDAYAKMGQTSAAQAQILKNTLVATLTDMGEIALPGLTAAANQIKNLVSAFSNLPQGVQNAAVIAAEFAAATLLIGSGAIKAITGIRSIVTAVQAAATAYTAATGAALTFQGAAIGLGVPALVAVAAAAVGTKLAVDSMAKGVKDAANAIGGDLGTAIKGVTTSNQDGLVSFLTGANVSAEKVAATTKAWAEGVNGAGRPTEELRSKLNDAANAYAKLFSEGKQNTAEAANYREVVNALSEVIAAREVAAQKQAEGAESQRIANEEAAQAALRIRDQTKAQERLNIAQAASKPGGLAPAGSNPNAGAQQYEDNVSGVMDSTLQTELNNQATAAYNAQKALVAYQDALNASAASNASAMQAIQGQIGPMTAALDLINQKRAQGLPITAQENQLLQQIPGSIGRATSAYSDLIIAQGQVALYNEQVAAGAGQGSGAFAGYGSQAAALTGQINTLAGSLVNLKSAFGALGSENADLANKYNILDARAQILRDKRDNKKGPGLTSEENTELAETEAYLKRIADQRGINEAKQRDIVKAELDTNVALAEQQRKREELNKVDLAAKSEPFNSREDRRTAVGPDLPPPPPPPPPPVVVPVKLDPNAQAQIEGELAGFTYNPAPVKVPVQLDTKALTGGAGVTASLFGNAVQAQTVKVDVQDNASLPLKTIQDTLAEMNGQTTTPKVTVQDDGTATIDGVTGALSTLGGITATPTASLNDLASGPLGEIQRLVDSLAGRSISITATVDTSAAMSAIQELRNNMPSSPAKEGPFKKLPTWDVYEGLRTNSEDAVISIQSTTAQMSRALGAGIADMTDESAKAAAELASTVAAGVNATVDALNRLSSFRPPDPRRFQALHDALTPIIAAFGSDAAASGEGGLKAAGEYADNASKIVNLISSGADALEKLGDFKRPTDQAIRDFRDVSQFLISVMLEVSKDTDAKLVEAGSVWAEGAGKIFASVSSGVDTLTKLQEFRRPTDRAVTDFRDVSQFLVNVMAQVAADAELGPVASAGEWAESAGKVFSAVGSGVDALIKLQDFQRPTDQAVKSFRDVSQYLVNVIAQVAADGEGPAFAGAASWAESAGKIFGALSSGVDALSKLDSFARPTDQAVNSFRDVAQYVVNVMAQVAADSDQGAVADAAKWAENAGKVLALLSVGVEGFAALATFERPTEAALRSFADTAALATRLIAEAAAAMDDKTLKNAGNYADTASKVVGLIGNGVESLGKLATGDLVLPDAGRLGAFAQSTRDAVIAISAAAQTIDGPALSAAATYSDGAGKVVSLIGNGVEGFNGLATFVAPSAGQIAKFKSAVSATVIAIAQAAKEIDQDAVKAAGEYADGAGKAVSLLGGAVSAFKSIGDKDFVVPSKEAIDAVISVTRYGVDQLIGISGSYGAGQLSQLSAFASAAGAGYSALGAALDAGKALGTEGRITPADALGQALSEFQAGLGPLGQLVTISQQYATQGAQIGANIAAAYNDIAGGLPGFNAQQATAAANVTVNGSQQQVIIHRHEPQVISLNFLGESGAWIVKSLTVDGGARTQTANLIAGEIASTLEAGAPA